MARRPCTPAAPTIAGTRARSRRAAAAPRHCRDSGNPASLSVPTGSSRIPAFAGMTVRSSRFRLRRDHAAPDLVELDRFEQRLEIAFAKALIALALDDLEE